MTEETFKLEELAHAAGTSARTIRYYVQRGLLPAPQFRGKDTAYGREHLVRLNAIRRLQEEYLPLEAIAGQLMSCTLAELERIAARRGLPTERHASSAASPPAPRRQRQTHERAEPSGLRAFTRIELAPGVELTIAEDAPPEARRLAERVLETYCPRKR